MNSYIILRPQGPDGVLAETTVFEKIGSEKIPGKITLVMTEQKEITRKKIICQKISFEESDLYQ